jgi:hypothetical protein
VRNPFATGPRSAPARRTSGPWRGRRYRFRPHNGQRERFRRIKQICLGQHPYVQSEQLQIAYASMQKLVEKAEALRRGRDKNSLVVLTDAS